MADIGTSNLENMGVRANPIGFGIWTKEMSSVTELAVKCFGDIQMETRPCSKIESNEQT